MSDPFEGKVVAITGAGKGLGRAYAHHFAELGASVVVNNRRHEGEQESSADRVVAEIVSNGGNAIAEYSSVEEPTSGDRLLSAALDHYGRLDCLVANAGVNEAKAFRKQTLEALRRVLEINLMGTVHVAHPVFRHLCDHGGGSIVVSTSSAGLFGEFGLPAYSASKAAIVGLMRSLSLEGSRKSVSVNAIAPYATTQMTAEHLPEEDASQLQPEQVAPVVAWLASGEVSGELIIAGGGRVARAGMKTSLPVAMGDFDVDAVQIVMSSDIDIAHENAGTHFRSFIGQSD